MDLVSRTLSGIQVATPILARMCVSDSFSVDMMEGAGLPFHHAVTRGVEIEMSNERFALAPGELVIFPRWKRHVVHFNGGGAQRTIIDLALDRHVPVWSTKEELDAPVELLIGPPPHTATLLSGNTWVNVEETAFITGSLPEMIRLDARQVSLQAVIAAVWELVVNELDQPSSGYAAVASRAVELLIVQALRSWLLGSAHPPGWARGIGHETVRRALQAMYQDPGRDWSLSALAEIAGQSRSSFAVSFREAMDETPFNHLRRLRIHLAAARLHHSRSSVAAIAADLGYASNYALARAFRQQTGLTATAFRRKARWATE